MCKAGESTIYWENLHGHINSFKTTIISKAFNIFFHEDYMQKCCTNASSPSNLEICARSAYFNFVHKFLHYHYYLYDNGCEGIRNGCTKRGSKCVNISKTLGIECFFQVAGGVSQSSVYLLLYQIIMRPLPSTTAPLNKHRTVMSVKSLL